MPRHTSTYWRSNLVRATRPEEVETEVRGRGLQEPKSKTEEMKMMMMRMMMRKTTKENMRTDELMLKIGLDEHACLNARCPNGGGMHDALSDTRCSILSVVRLTREHGEHG